MWNSRRKYNKKRKYKSKVNKNFGAKFHNNIWSYFFRYIRSIGMIYADGNLVFTDGFKLNVSNKDYFSVAMKNKATYRSNPSFVKGTDEQIIFVAVPLINNGKTVGAMTCTFDSSFLLQDIKSLSLSRNNKEKSDNILRLL